MSYIPRSSASASQTPGAIPALVRKKRTFRVFGFIATLMLVASVLSVAGTYLYKGYVMDQLEEAQAMLAQASSTDTSETIADLEAFDKKIQTAQVLLDNHLAPSKVFEALEENTKGTVQFLTFNYTYDPGFQAFLELSATTDDFMSVTLQNLEFLKGVVFTEFVVGGLGVSDEESEGAQTSEQGVTFTVTGSLEKERFTYTGSGGGAVPETETSDDLTVPPGEETAGTDESTDGTQSTTTEGTPVE